MRNQKKKPKVNKKTKIVRIISLIFTVAAMVAIFCLSAQPGNAGEATRIIVDTYSHPAGVNTNAVIHNILIELIHFFGYMLLAAPLYIFFQTLHRGTVHAGIAAYTISILYAVGDEIHQIFVPGRVCTVNDMLLDSLGAALCIFALKSMIKTGKKTEPIDNTEAEQRFLAVCSSHLTGEPIPFGVLTDAETQSIFQVAAVQRLMPVVYSTLKKQGKLNGDSPLVKEMRRLSLLQMGDQAVKTEAFLAIYAKMLEAGAKPLCVKGIVCRSYYRHPDQRPSCDEDILVKKQDWNTCTRVLEDAGYTLTADEPGEFTYVHPANGSRIEVHATPFKLNTPSSAEYNALLTDIFEDAVTMEYKGRTIYCPSADDHLLYLYLHAFKHFINAGVGIRQIMDIAVFSQNNKVSYIRLRRRFRTVGLSRFAANVMVICGRYFGFDLSPVKSTDPDFDERTAFDPLLDDILSGGIYGGSLTRKHAAALTGNENMSVLKALFPSRDQLKNRYTSLKKHGWLLPAVWLKRGVLFLFEDSSAQVLEEAKRRSELIKNYKQKESTEYFN